MDGMPIARTENSCGNPSVKQNYKRKCFALNKDRLVDQVGVEPGSYVLAPIFTSVFR